MQFPFFQPEIVAARLTESLAKAHSIKHDKQNIINGIKIRFIHAEEKSVLFYYQMKIFRAHSTH